VVAASDGTYTLYDSTGVSGVIATVTFASLPSGDQTDTNLALGSFPPPGEGRYSLVLTVGGTTTVAFDGGLAVTLSTSAAGTYWLGSSDGKYVRAIVDEPSGLPTSSVTDKVSVFRPGLEWLNAKVDDTYRMAAGLAGGSTVGLADGYVHVDAVAMQEYAVSGMTGTLTRGTQGSQLATGGWGSALKFRNYIQWKSSDTTLQETRVQALLPVPGDFVKAPDTGGANEQIGFVFSTDSDSTADNYSDLQLIGSGWSNGAFYQSFNHVSDTSAEEMVIKDKTIPLSLIEIGPSLDGDLALIVRFRLFSKGNKAVRIHKVWMRYQKHL